MRPFDEDQINKPYALNACPAYLAIKNSCSLPNRIKDSEITTMTLKDELFTKFYQLNCIEEKYITQKYKEYNSMFRVKLD